MVRYTEDDLVQRTTAEYLRDNLGWESVYAYNTETFGTDGTLGRLSGREVVLTRYLHQKLVEFNPGLPETAYEDAVRQIVETSVTQTSMATNREKYLLLKDGVQVTFRNDKDELKRQRLRVFDFKYPENNHFLCVRELWIQGDIYHKRPDIIGFVNGIPLLFIECKNVHKNLETAYNKNFADYKDTIPHIFHHNAFVMLANGIEASIGSITSKYIHFAAWKRLEEDEPGVVDMETMLKGVCNQGTFMDLFENFITFDESSGKTVKIIARNHQYLGVNLAIQAVRNRETRQHKLGVFWHTQGAGKSYSMVFFTAKVRRKLGGNYTFLICTDREDLDRQIYNTFAGCGLADNDREPCRAASEKGLKKLLGQHKAFVFTLIQKFRQEAVYSERDDIIVISDEAHRTQYGTLSLNMRRTLPNASYIGFTGTPLFKDDEITRRVFGEYISTYDFQRAVEDKATVPLFYDARGEKLGIDTTDVNERIAAKLEELEIEDIDVQQRLEKELKRDYHIITAKKRLDQIAQDFVDHYSKAWESGKAMLVCIDKITCVKLYNLITDYWKKHIEKLEAELHGNRDDEDEIIQRLQIAWMKETQIGVVVSEEQGEVDKFRKQGLDIKTHRKLLKDGFVIPEHLRRRPEFSSKQRLDPDSAFKEEDHPFRIAIVCAMWLTGFDVPSLATLYLDKPLKAHTLMQAIARANRFNEGKENGLIVDYCGILKNLRKALATFTVKPTDDGEDGTDPTRPEEELLEELDEVIGFVEAFLVEKNASLAPIIEKTGFERNAAILAAKEAANENDETRKRFEVICREVFRKFKACINVDGVVGYRKQYDATNIIYRSLLEDREKADISDIIKQLHEIVDQAIETRTHITGEERAPYNIAAIDFERLRTEFEHSPVKNTTTQNLRQVVETRLSLLLQKNPLRADLQAHYQQIVEDYNQEKDRANIEKTFEALLKFIEELDEEEGRAIREGLDEESLAIFDLLKKPQLSLAETKRVKEIAAELLETLKQEKLRIDHWRDREATRDAVRVTIYDFLYADQTGLPEQSYTTEDIHIKTEDVFRHVYRVYPTVPSPYYS